MKQAIIIGVFGLLFNISCSTSQQAGNENNTPSAGSSQTLAKKAYAMKGTWQITEVDYANDLKIKPFDEGADAQCFVGSEWKLVPNNNTGSYTLPGSESCPSITRQIKFDVTSSGNFQFKKLSSDLKAKEVSAGYILQLEELTDNHFTLVQNVSFEGKIIKVYYTFQKISK